MNVGGDDILEDIRRGAKDVKFDKQDMVVEKSSDPRIKKIFIKGQPYIYYLKQVDIKNAVASIASSKMYNKIGIATPAVSLYASPRIFTETIATIQPDVSQLKGVQTILAAEDLEYSKLSQSFFTKYKWQLFYDNELKMKLLTFMTQKCLEALQNIFLIDELRTDSDRHTKNYSFYKSKGASLYEGVVAIDLEQMQIFMFCGSKKEDFDNFVSMSYSSATPQQTEDCLIYMQRIKDIRELIDDGVLNQNNIDTIIKALEFDFPKEAKQLCKGKNLNRKTKNSIITPVERLWELNRDTIGKDLGL